MVSMCSLAFTVKPRPRLASNASRLLLLGRPFSSRVKSTFRSNIYSRCLPIAHPPPRDAHYQVLGFLFVVLARLLGALWAFYGSIMGAPCATHGSPLKVCWATGALPLPKGYRGSAMELPCAIHSPTLNTHGTPPPSS